jgi:hypothetical protein
MPTDMSANRSFGGSAEISGLMVSTGLMSAAVVDP